jgi:hypothetical protein
MLAEQLKASPDSHYGFKRSLSAVASSAQSVRSLAHALGDPFAAFASALEIKVFGHDANDVQSLVNDAASAVRQSGHRCVKVVTWAIAGTWAAELPKDLPGMQSVRR